MLIGTGTGHFLVPKPFDTIVPAELPGSPRTYTYLSGIAEIATGALLSLPGTPPIWRACGRCPIYRRLSGERQHGAAVVAQGVADANRRLGPAAIADSDDRRGAQSQAQRLAPSAKSWANSSGPGSLSGTTVAPVRT